MRLALRGMPLLVVALGSGAAWAQSEGVQDAHDKMVQLNKQAIADVDDLEWDRAKKLLLDALIVGKRAGLEAHPLMARTYLHLGAVYVTGFKNRAKAGYCFVRALEIAPDIKLSPAMATAEMNEVFAEAAGPRRTAPRLAARDGGRDEPELPARVSALDCYYAETTRVDQAVPVRCAVAQTLPVTRVFLLFREPVTQRFAEAELKRMPTGWFKGRVPERVILGPSVQLYFEGRNAAGKPIVRNGEEQTPNVILVVKR